MATTKAAKEKTKKNGGQAYFTVELTMTESLLGSTPKNKNVYETFIATKAQEFKGDDGVPQTDDEIATAIDDTEARGWTGFHHEDGDPSKRPLIYNYVVKGFLKAACGAMRDVGDSASSGMSAYKTKIDKLAFVYPRHIVLEMPAGSKMGVLERPLRAETAQGPRVTLARSDTSPAGTKLRFEVMTLNDGIIGEEQLREWFDYGQYSGLGQWRSGGNGTFTFTLTAGRMGKG